MINSKKNQKILLYTAVFAGVVLLAEKTIFSGLRDRIKNLYQKTKQEEVNLKTAIDIQKRKDKIALEYESYKAYLEAENLSDTEVFTKFLKEIESMAQQSGVMISSLNPHDELKQAGDYKMYEADLRSETSEAQMIDFLYKIQTSKMPMRVNKLTISPKDEKAETLKVDISVSVIIL
ncbi:MAG: GspMb/PilO family protein [Candidatus Omnitrophota bacterium]